MSQGLRIINDGGRGENRKLIKTENNGGDRKTQESRMPRADC